MNNKKRKRALRCIELLKTIQNDITSLIEEEEESMENMPENLQCSETYLNMEDAVENLNKSVDHIEDAIDCLHI